MRNSIKLIEIPQWGIYLRYKWEQFFASHLSEAEKSEMYFDNFLWHLCSWKKVNCVANADAISLFIEEKKRKCTIFYQHTNDAYLIEHASNLTVQDLPHDPFHSIYGDMYVMDWHGKWTFIMTHESDCGPYFIKNK